MCTERELINTAIRIAQGQVGTTSVGVCKESEDTKKYKTRRWLVAVVHNGKPMKCVLKRELVSKVCEEENFSYPLSDVEHEDI